MREALQRSSEAAGIQFFQSFAAADVIYNTCDGAHSHTHFLLDNFSDIVRRACSNPFYGG